MRMTMPRLLAAALLLAIAHGPGVPEASAQGASASSKTATFKAEELDQMMAPIALYPDSLLAQVLMASTYPGDVADAVKWSEKNKDAKGEAAVKQVANQPWDPSVQSLVAFPQLLAVLGQDPAWVQKMGDAFLAQPEDVMASVQRLRHQADAAGNLKSNDQQVVSKESTPAPAAATTTQAPPQTIIIESKDPEVVYVPSYNPSVVYGSWMYPSYPPYYYPPPAYYYPGAALFSFGVGVAVGGALWGDCDWGGGDIDIDVDRYNNINTNRQIDRSNNKFNHNAANRDGVPYRDNASRERYGNQREGAGQRDAYRGRDNSQARNAERDRARQSMERSGIQGPATSNAEARQRAGQASRDMGNQRGGSGQRANAGAGAGGQRANAGNTAAQRPQASNTRAQQDARQRSASSQPRQQNNAFSGAGSPSQSRAASSRGHNSYSASQRSSGARSAGRPVQRSAPSRGGGGGRRR